jgi:hypothetical protein
VKGADVFAPHPGVSLDSGTTGEEPSGGFAREMPATQVSPAQLGYALDAVAKSRTPFMGRYILLGSRSRQVHEDSTTQLARGKSDDLEYALKVC